MQIGLSCCGRISKDVFRQYAEAGIPYMEISLGSEDYDHLDMKEIQKNANEYGIKLWSYHLPFAPFSRLNPASLNRELRSFTVSYFEELIRQAAEQGLDKFVVHASGEPIPEEDRAESMKWAKESLNTLADFAHERGAVLAVEDLPRTCLGNCSQEILEMLNVNERLRVCFDTNHLLMEDAAQFIRAVGNKIITTHVSDFDFVNERHWLPGEGKLDWQNLLKALDEIGYTGIWLYEINLDCPKTIYRDRPLTYTDFVENAKALFAGEKPRIFSRPKPNLGMWE